MRLPRCPTWKSAGDWVRAVRWGYTQLQGWFPSGDHRAGRGHGRGFSSTAERGEPLPSILSCDWPGGEVHNIVIPGSKYEVVTPTGGLAPVAPSSWSP